MRKNGNQFKKESYPVKYQEMDYSVLKPIVDKVEGKSMSTWRRKKKPSVTVTDGYFRFIVNLKTLSCSCPFKQIGPCPCVHVIRVLLDYLEPEDLIILFIPYIMEKTITNQIIGNLDKYDLVKTIDSYYHELECPICLDFFSERRYHDLTQCSTCFNVFHTACDKKWRKTGKGCSLCLT